ARKARCLSIKSKCDNGSLCSESRYESKKRKPGPILKFRDLCSTIDVDILPEVPGTMASACL
ncbi:hypothetical protein L210DRAFT_3587304, partial [Boletus edulis BED1]